MPRPAKPVSIDKSARTKKETGTRIEIEQKMKAGKLASRPPSMLNKEQKKIYKWLFNTLEPTGFMTALDIEILVQGSVIIERLRAIDRQINDNPMLITDREMRTSRDLYYKQFLKIAEQLCMSPQARAKMGTLVANNQPDPLESILGGSDA